MVNFKTLVLVSLMVVNASAFEDLSIQHRGYEATGALSWLPAYIGKAKELAQDMVQSAVYGQSSVLPVEAFEPGEVSAPVEQAPVVQEQSPSANDAAPVQPQEAKKSLAERVRTKLAANKRNIGIAAAVVVVTGVTVMVAKKYYAKKKAAQEEVDAVVA